MDIAKSLHKLSLEIENDLRLTGHHIVPASSAAFAPAVVEYLQHRYPQARINLQGDDGHFIVNCVEPAGLDGPDTSDPLYLMGMQGTEGT